MKKKIYYSGEAVKQTIDNLTAAGATHKRFFDSYGVNTEVITKPGYKTLVFIFQGTHEDGRSLYSLRKYNSTPAKYA